MSDIYHGFSCQIEFMAANMSCCPICVSKFGSSHERTGTIYELPFYTKNPKWQRICVPTRHVSNHLGKKSKMAAHMRANPIYEQPFEKNSKMSAHVSRMAAHMSVFLCFRLCIPVPRPLPVPLPIRLRLYLLI